MLFFHFNLENNIGVNGVQFISDALKVNSSLQYVVLYRMCDFIIHHSIQSILTLFFILIKGILLVMMDQDSYLMH